MQLRLAVDLCAIDVRLAVCYSACFVVKYLAQPFTVHVLRAPRAWFACSFARSGQFSGVVAADFSENMLKQAKTYFQVRA